MPSAHTHSDAGDAHEAKETLALLVVLLRDADLPPGQTVNVLGGTSLAGLLLRRLGLLSFTETLLELAAELAL